MIITQARIEDLEGILALEQDGFAPGEQWSPESWAAELTSTDRFVLTNAAVDGDLLGVAAFSCTDDMADLNRVVVHRQSRGRGVAASLVRGGLEWAQAVGATRMLLEVRNDNTTALDLYRRLGFDQISQRRDYYGPGLDAVVMLRAIGEDDETWAIDQEAQDWAVAE